MELEDILKSHILIKAKSKKRIIDEKNVTFLMIRDAIWNVGRVIEELESEETYIAEIKAGFLNWNSAYLAIRPNEDNVEIVGCADEGMIYQYTVEKAIDKFEKSLYTVIGGKPKNHEK